MDTVFFILFLLLLTGGTAIAVFYRHQSQWVAGFSASRGLPYWIAALLCLFISMGITTVDAGNIGVVKRFGNPTRELYPGIHFILPIADDVTMVTVQTRIVNPSENAASHDLQIVHTEVTLAFRVDPQYATSILVDLNNDEVTRVIVPAILEAIKATTAQYDVQELISKRPLVRDGIENFVKARLEPYHIIAQSTSITDFSFSKEFEDAIEAKVTAIQNAEKATNDLKRIQIQAQQQVAQAQGEADALKAQKEQITPELLQLRTIEMMKEKWDGHLPVTMVGGSGALPMMDVLQAARERK